MKSYVITVLRVIIGCTFVYMGWIKTQDPVAFLKTIREFDVVTIPWQMNALAAWLPWFEVWCGCLLVLGIGVRTTSVVLSALLMLFTGMILWRALEIHSAGGIAFCAIQFDCGCGSGEVVVCYKLAQNVLLTVASVVIACSKQHRLALWPTIRIPAMPDKSQAS